MTYCIRTLKPFHEHASPSHDPTIIKRRLHGVASSPCTSVPALPPQFAIYHLLNHVLTRLPNTHFNLYTPHVPLLVSVGPGRRLTPGDRLPQNSYSYTHDTTSRSREFRKFSLFVHILVIFFSALCYSIILRCVASAASTYWLHHCCLLAFFLWMDGLGGRHIYAL